LAVIVDLVALTVPKASWAETTPSFLYPAGALSAAVAFLSGHQAAATVLMPGMAHPLLLQPPTIQSLGSQCVGGGRLGRTCEPV
jgi:hypothetical protein